MHLNAVSNCATLILELNKSFHVMIIVCILTTS